MATSKPQAPRATTSKATQTAKAAKARKPREQPALFLLDDEDPAVVLARDLGGVVGGLDEAGRGPLAGPVVAACVVLPYPLPEALLPLNDSKALDEEAREALFPLIQQLAVAWGVAAVEAGRIDEINILRASLEAMAIALERCEAMLGGEVKGALLDGNQRAPLPGRVIQKTLIGGDAKSRPIMAASILAKVSRDRRMKDEHARFPAYGFDVHKGYGTPRHLETLHHHGPCPLHRRSFAPVREAWEARTPSPVAPALLPTTTELPLPPTTSGGGETVGA
jgi:ribonuclease HII